MSGADYFSYSNLVPGQLARSADVNSRMAAIQTAFGLLPAPELLQQNRIGYAADTGAANALVVAMPTKALASYVVGLELSVKIAADNTGAATINVDGLGTKTILRSNGNALQAGDLPAGAIVKLIYDGTSFRLLGATEASAAASATAAANSATAAATSATNAASSDTSASTSATNAATSASNAAASASAAAQSASDAATAVSGYVAKAGSTMTGPLTLSGAPTVDLHAATKKYVDDAVFAAGAYTADGATITLSAGQFSLTTIANNAVLGNVSGGVAKPGALTATQLTAMLNAATGAAQGAMSAADKSKLDAITGTNTGDQTNISGNAGTATKLQTARTIAISGAVTGSATSFDGSANITIPITAMNMDSATSGVLAVARGGTGVQTSTGTGSNVLNTSPVFAGTASFNAITAGSLVLTNPLPAASGGTGVTTSTGNGGAVVLSQGTPVFIPTSISQDVFNGGIEVREVNAVGSSQSSTNYSPGVTFHWAQRVASQIYINSSGDFGFGAQGDKATFRRIYVAGVTSTSSISATSFSGALNMADASSGVLAVARGGTGVTGSTGSGNNVLSDSPTFTGTLNAATISASGNVTAYSDRRLKRNIHTIDGAKALAMRGVTFTRETDDGDSAGVIAQELREVAPELVLADDDGKLSVNYLGLTGYLIEAVKLLDQRLKALEA